MKTEERLMSAYHNARVEFFDEQSKYVFFSDCHRGNGSISDEFLKNSNTYLHALEYYFKNGFTYVEVGDGDELWEYPQFKIVKEAHSDVFHTMKKFFDENRLIIIYGNHNIYLKDARYVKANYCSYFNELKQEHTDLFKQLKPCEALVLKHKKTGQEILTLHGHQGDFANDQMWRYSMITLKYFWKYLHAFGIRNPSSPVRNTFKRHKLERYYDKWIKKHRMMLICGHTHRFRYPKSGEPPYFNCGCCVYPTSVTALEMAEGKIWLVQWRILADEDGLLQITRIVLQGPEPLETFDIR